MEDIQAARDLAAKILDTNGDPVNYGEGIPVNFGEGVPVDDSEEGGLRLLDDAAGDSVPSTSPEFEVPDFDPDAVPVFDPDSNVPVSDLRPRRKRRTEVENLEIDLKGWNYTNFSPVIESLVSDNLSPLKNEDDVDSKMEQLSSEQSDSDLYLNFKKLIVSMTVQCWSECISSVGPI